MRECDLHTSVATVGQHDRSSRQQLRVGQKRRDTHVAWQARQPELLGLAGKYAIIKTPGGPTDLVAEGGELAGVKLLRIGLNRVLVEYQGKTHELTIFSGLGSTPLLAPSKENKP